MMWIGSDRDATLFLNFLYAISSFQENPPTHEAGIGTEWVSACKHQEKWRPPNFWTMAKPRGSF